MRRQLLALSAIFALLVTFAAGMRPSPSSGGKQKLPAKDTTPIAPAIPSANRHDPSRVFLEHADKLHSSAGTDFQVLTGDVRFRRDGMFMWCDSAHFFDATGSFDAFGNVKMQQGDTLFIYGDTLHYDEPQRLATLIGYPGHPARLINREVTLTTEEFNYNLDLDLGYYEIGGTLVDNQNRLTSLEGEYSPSTKEATFREGVKLTSLNKDDTLTIVTDNLYYNTLSHVAMLVAPSVVTNRDGHILTSNGIYNTETTRSELYDRSTVVYKNGNTLIGDTLNYNRELGIGEGWGNVEITDTTNHVILRGDYGYAFEPTDSAYVTGHAYAIEYSTADTLHLHGDTIRTFRREVLRMVTDTIPIPADSLNIAADSVAIAGDIVADAASTFSADGFADLSVSQPPVEADEVSHEPITEPTAEPTSEPAITSPAPAKRHRTIRRQSTPSQPAEADSAALTATTASTATDSVALPQTVVDPLPRFTVVEREQLDTVHYLVAAPKVKFYRSDIQGLCDSMTLVSADSMLYMDRFPIVWSENRQVLGDLIKIKFNDSTAERAHIIQNAFMIEEIEEGYYNQLAGKEMDAFFTNGALSHLDVNGNVLAITFPEESDSTINKMMHIESSYLSADFANNAITHMRLWSETNATVTPLFLAKPANMFLQRFRWLTPFRPTSPTDIFEFSPELLEAFSTATTYQPPKEPWKQTPSLAPSSPSSMPQSATSLPPTQLPDSSDPSDLPSLTPPTSGTLSEEETTLSEPTVPQSSLSASEPEQQPTATE